MFMRLEKHILLKKFISHVLDGKRENCQLNTCFDINHVSSILFIGSFGQVKKGVQKKTNVVRAIKVVNKEKQSQESL